MDEQNNTQQNQVVAQATAPAAAPVQAAAKPAAPGQQGGRGSFRGGQGGRGSFRGGPRPGGKGGPRDPKVKPEFDQKLISIRRVTRVASGGRRFSFSVAMVAGNRKGSVGVGTGKAGDTSLAIEKAFRSAKKNMIRLNLTKTSSIPHDVEIKYSSARIKMWPAAGKGLVAGSSVRHVLELAGVKDISAKILSGSKNHLNIARAAILALSKFKA